MRGADAIFDELHAIRHRIVRSKEMGYISKQYADKALPLILDLIKDIEIELNEVPSK